MDKRTVLIPIQIDKDWVESVVSSALCGGINYWLEDYYCEDKKGAEYLCEVLPLGGEIVLIVDDNYGGECKEVDGYAEGYCAYKLNLDALIKGFEKYCLWARGLNRRFYTDASDIDVTESDCIVQLALFGDVIFG